MQVGRQTGRQTGRQADKQADRQTNRQIGRHRKKLNRKMYSTINYIRQGTRCANNFYKVVFSRYKLHTFTHLKGDERNEEEDRQTVSRSGSLSVSTFS